MPRRVAAATLCLIAACVIAGCGGDGDPPAGPPGEPPPAEATGSSRWRRRRRPVDLLGRLRARRGAHRRRARLLGGERRRRVRLHGRSACATSAGTQDFTGDEDASLAGDQFELQRTLRDSEIVERAQERGMKMYLGAYLSNYNNTARRRSSTGSTMRPGRRSHFLGLATSPRPRGSSGSTGSRLDQELYGQKDQVATATWEWDYPGNTHSEDEVREAARQRGEQVMETVLGEFPGAELAVYHFSVPRRLERAGQGGVRRGRGRGRGSAPP